MLRALAILLTLSTSALADHISVYPDAGPRACPRYEGYTVAHRTLKCGTRVRLTVGRHSVVARVGDRGPFADMAHRQWDAPLSTARALGFTDGVPAVNAQVLQ